ncbi:MmcQ/YjbR family DNA-binding protein [Flavihumibacter sp. R14]|nr:MmcQ/YjbR family DNA-binding protein [Flavihumibacter soli]
MVAIDTFRTIALSFPETTEQPHFEKTSFRVQKKIFATLDIQKAQACVKLSEIDQDVFSSFNRSAIFPVPNKWGKQGWTLINLNEIAADILNDALLTSYCGVAPKRLSADLKDTRQEP